MGSLVKAMSGGGTGSSDTRCMVALVARDADGQQFMIRDVMGGGSGGRSYADGADCVTANVAGRNMPCEFFEAFYPVRVERLALRPDSGGPGKFRGGLGYLKDIRFLADGFLMIADDRMLLQPFGAAGGKAGAGSIYTLNPGVGEQIVPTKTDYLPVKKGDLLRVMTPGGGGWGDPLDRVAASVLEDVSLGLVSIAAAESEDGVAIDGEAMKVRAAETEKLRAERRRTRAALHIIDRGDRFERLRRAGRISLTSEDPVLGSQAR